jgi:hypothetical protein
MLVLPAGMLFADAVVEPPMATLFFTAGCDCATLGVAEAVLGAVLEATAASTVLRGTPAARALALAASMAAGVLAVSNSCSNVKVASTTSSMVEAAVSAVSVVSANATVAAHMRSERKKFRMIVLISIDFID